MTLANQKYSKTTGEVRSIAVSFVGKLATEHGEILIGTPVVSGGSLTYSGVQLNTEPELILGQAVPIAQAVLFKVAAGTVGDKVISVLCSTDKGQTLEVLLRLEIV